MNIDIFEIDEPRKLNELSSFSLSYIGDAIFELWCRQKILSRFQNRKIVHSNVVQWVRCQTQAKIAKIIHNRSPVITTLAKRQVTLSSTISNRAIV